MNHKIGMIFVSLLWAALVHEAKGYEEIITAPSSNGDWSFVTNSITQAGIIFDARGGTVDPGHMLVARNTLFGSLPTPVRDGNRFCGWWTEVGGAGTQITANTLATNAHNTVYAFWLATASDVSWNLAADFSVTNGNPNGAWSYGYVDTWSWSGAFLRYQTGNYTGVSGSPIWHTAQTNSPDCGSVFLNRSSDVQEGAAPGQLSIQPGSNSIPAGVRWTAPSNAYGVVTVSGQFFSGGVASPRIVVRYKDASVWSGTDAGVFALTNSIAASNTIDFIVSGDYAGGATPLDAVIAVNCNRHTLRFDAQGGSVASTLKTVTYSANYGDLPIPTRSAYVFDGWWTGTDGTGSEISSDTLVNATNDVTLYANWTYTYAPQLTQRRPATNQVSISEGSSIRFSVVANDSLNPNSAKKGLTNIAWYVDGALAQNSRMSSTTDVASAYVYSARTNIVSGGALQRDVSIRVVAKNIEGYTASATWALRIYNKPTSQTITFLHPPIKALGDEDFDLNATASSGLTVQYASSNEAVARIVGRRVQIVGAGTTVITATQPGNSDYLAAPPVQQKLFVKTRLTANITGRGTVDGTGLYLPGTQATLKAKPLTGSAFLHWENSSQLAARTVVVPVTNSSVSAWFDATTNVPPAEIDDPGPQSAMVGVPFVLPLVVRSASLPSVSVPSLPFGLSFDARTCTIVGVPNAATTNRPVTIQVRNAGPHSAQQTFSITIAPLPAWAQGDFSGWFAASESDYGTVAWSVTPKGTVSGKLTAAGTASTFKTAAFQRLDADGTLWLAAATQSRTDPRQLLFAVRKPAEGVPSGVAFADGWFGLSAESNAVARAYRGVWKDAREAAVLTNGFVGYYTATLPGGKEYGSGYLTLTVDKAGAVKTAGMLADGTSVSTSGPMILDETGRLFVVIYATPSFYKGGSLFGLAEFVRGSGAASTFVRPLNGELLWANSNPQATADYGAGFSRSVNLVGGWYDTVGNLYRYYAGRELSIDANSDAAAPELSVGTNRYASVWWRPDGVGVTISTNRSGVMTGLSAAPAGRPIQTVDGYEYESVTNAVALTLSLTKATGVFKGAFNLWFDYATTHTSKQVRYEGVLTPVRSDSAVDPTEGRGFFLWSEKSAYRNAKNQTIPYSFNESYDLFLLASPQE